MKIGLCTISFRHQLVSIDALADWASNNHFDGIELWGAHALNLAEFPHYNAQWLAQKALYVSMLSDYLPLMDDLAALTFKTHQLCRLAIQWNTRKIRTFAGTVGSAQLSAEHFRLLCKRLRYVCDILATYGLQLVIETHPNTFADSLDSVNMLFDSVGSNNMKLNFDVLHVWESNTPLDSALNTWAQHIEHFHFKNVSDTRHLSVFEPNNVYSAAGSREGMVPLFRGILDYKRVIRSIVTCQNHDLLNKDVSLEWFGNQCRQVLSEDRFTVAQHCQLLTRMDC